MGQVYELTRSSLWEQYGAITPIEAADAMASVYNNAFYCEPPPMTQAAFEVKKNADQTVTANTFAQMVFGNEVTNVGGGWDDANNQFVAPVKGFYSFQTSIQSAGLNLLQIGVNGTNRFRCDPNAANTATLAVSMALNASDTVTVTARTTGTNIAGNLNRSYFTGHLVYELP